MRHPDRFPTHRWGVIAACALLSTVTPFPAGEAAEPGTAPEPPVEIEADQADMDAESGISVYTGDAILTRGEMRITGDVMEVYTDRDGALERVFVRGQPATYYDHPVDQPRPVQGQAETMEYFTSGPERVILRGAAHLWQGQDEITGESIHADLERQWVEARSGEGRRARTVIYPGQREESSQ